MLNWVTVIYITEFPSDTGSDKKPDILQKKPALTASILETSKALKIHESSAKKKMNNRSMYIPEILTEGLDNVHTAL